MKGQVVNRTSGQRDKWSHGKGTSGGREKWSHGKGTCGHKEPAETRNLHALM